MADDFAGLSRRLKDLESNRGASLRWGTVTEVDERAGSARVQIADADGLVTMPLRVLQHRTLKDQHQELPDVGEQVACIFSGQGFEQGVVLGAIYSDKDASPGRPPHVWFRKFEDGTELEYDRACRRLTAKLKGDAEVEADGHIYAKAMREVVIESAERTLIKAPHIHLAGKLCMTDADGRAGEGDMYGNYRVREGGIKVDEDVIAVGMQRSSPSATGVGTVDERVAAFGIQTFSSSATDGVNGDEDVVVQEGISLLDHAHSGVEPGPGVTDMPVGGGGGSQWQEDAPLSEQDRILSVITDPVDRIIRCLPDIAGMEAWRTKEQEDKQGWTYLRHMFLQWLGGQANDNARSNPDIFPVSWDWVMQFERSRTAYQNFTSPERKNEGSNIYNSPARKQIADFLERDHKLTSVYETFDYTILPPADWYGRAFNFYTVDHVMNVDGLQAAMGAFTLRALAKGYVEPNAQGGHTITVTQCAVFVFDTFNFEGNLDFYGYWSCEEKKFLGAIDLLSIFGGDARFLTNGDFREFRSRYGIGGDFKVQSALHFIENFEEMRYD